MTDDIQEEAERAFRPGRRPAWIAIALNGVLLLSALGVPYVRGRMRADDAAAHFARFAACLYGGRPDADPGLALPAGDRERFAAQVERAGAAWPGPCVEILRAMRPEPAIFLFPSPKQAEEDLRRALDITEGELDALARARGEGGIGAVPERPLRAIGALRSALANLLQASDAVVDPTRPALVWEDDATIVAPSRIPLLTAEGGTTVARVEPGGLRAMSSDGRTISEVTVRTGSVEQVHERRPTSARGVTLGPEGGYVLWITSESTCSTDPARCASRLLGVGTLVEGEREPSPRWWLAAHPAGRVDRAVRIETARVDVIAVAAEGTELRTFELAEQAAPGAGEGAGEGAGAGEGEGEGEGAGESERVTPATALAARALGATLDARIGARAESLIEEDGALRLVGRELPSSATPDPGHEAAAGIVRVPFDALGGRPRPGHVALFGCGEWTAIATAHAIVVVPPTNEPRPIARELREPLLGAAYPDDAVRVVCRTDGGADVIALDDHRAVVRWSCDRERCAEAQIVARGAAQIDAAHAGGTTLVAWTGDTTHPQVRVARVRGDVIGGPEVPAPCWDSEQGLCGAPIVIADGDTLMVGAREETDLLVLQLADTGFRRLDGL